MSDELAQRLIADLLDRVGDAAAASAVRVDAAHELEIATGAGAVEVIALCETVVRIAQGLQADAVADLDARRREVVGSSLDERGLCRSLYAEIGLARQTSATAGESSYRLARDLADHPKAHALLREGAVNQSVVAAVCRETVFLDPQRRAEVDAELAPHLSDLGPKRAAAAARRLVIDKEPHAAFERTVRARGERHVRFRAELDAMATLSVYAPAAQLAAAWRRFDDEASVRRGDGDPRTIAQIACDLAVEALAGAAVSPDGSLAADVEIGVLMRSETLLGSDDTSAVLQGYGPIPGELARQLATGERSWLRRFFTAPGDHQPRSVDPRRRRFPAGIARLVRAADEWCARPWCECRVREIDHTTPYARGGESMLENADGLCRADNLLKETRGWQVERDAAGTRTWSSPTGHRYAANHRSQPAAPWSPPGAWPSVSISSPTSTWSPMEDRLRHLVTVSRR